MAVEIDGYGNMHVLLRARRGDEMKEMTTSAVSREQVMQAVGLLRSDAARELLRDEYIRLAHGEISGEKDEECSGLLDWIWFKGLSSYDHVLIRQELSRRRVAEDN